MTRWLSDEEACERYAVTPETLLRYAGRGNLAMRRPSAGADPSYAEDGLTRLFPLRGTGSFAGMATLGQTHLGGDPLDSAPITAVRERRIAVRTMTTPHVPERRRLQATA